MMSFDVHTHHYRPEDPCLQVLNVRLTKDFTLAQLPPPAGNLILSAGIHPWDTEFFISSKGLEEWLFLVLSEQRIKYIGEIGIDKLKGSPVSHQLSLLKVQLDIADKLKKPVIIHCVRAMQDILSVKSCYPAIPEWIVHGFRGKVPQARQWLDHGFNLSFGQKYDAEAFDFCPKSRRYCETDDS